MNNIIKKRVETVFRSIGGTYEIVPDDIVGSTIDKLWDELQLTPRKTAIKTINGANLSSQEIKNFLGSLRVDPKVVTTLIWPSYRNGIYIPFQLFIDHYDDLWYPGSDDIWITDRNMNWLLVIDHEENITLFQF